MKKYILLLSILVLLLSCSQNKKFKIIGIIINAQNKTLIFEHNELLKTTIIDSVILDSDGSFSFKAPIPEFPDFYRLRIADKTIDIAVDSCKEIKIKGDFNNFSTGYIVEGSKTNTDILKLRASLSAIQSKANAISVDLSSEERNKRLKEIEADIENHKAMAINLILQNPSSSAAYFAIYQKINNSYLFSPYIKADKPYFAAVATAYNTFMPTYIRSKNLYSLVIDAMKSDRKERSSALLREIAANSSTGYIEISLHDAKGNVRKLSEQEGKVVLIDFSSTDMRDNAQYTFELRDLYYKYKHRGFEIYQISLDNSKLKWKESTANSPWICVRDEQGAATHYISSYNIQSIPTIFLMNKKGVIVARESNFKAIDEIISKLL
jgi:peroxiredoxin